MNFSATKPDTFHHKTAATSPTRLGNIDVVSANLNQSKIRTLFALLLADYLLHTSAHASHVPATLLPRRRNRFTLNP
jgi:hypothetical protein